MIPTIPNGEPQKGHTPATHAPADSLRPLSPKESLGLSSQSGLLKASALAGIGFVVVFAVLTFGPYFWEKSQAATKANAPAAKPDAPAAGQPAAAPAPSTPDPAASQKLPAGAPTAGKPAGKGDIVDKLGENATKTAPAKVNPLDKKDDDILKEIK